MVWGGGWVRFGVGMVWKGWMRGVWEEDMEVLIVVVSWVCNMERQGGIIILDCNLGRQDRIISWGVVEHWLYTVGYSMKNLG